MTFDDYTPPKKGGNCTTIFVRAKACPLTFRPIGNLRQYTSVYDPELKRNRRPVAGERGSKRYLVNGVGLDGEVRAYDIGSTIVAAIQNARKTAVGMGGSPDRAYDITATGTGIDTQYAASATPLAVAAKLNAIKVENLVLHDLAKIEESIVVALPTQNADDIDAPWDTDGIGLRA